MVENIFFEFTFPAKQICVLNNNFIVAHIIRIQIEEENRLQSL